MNIPAAGDEKTRQEQVTRSAAYYTKAEKAPAITNG